MPHLFWRYYLLGGISSFLVSLINPSGIGLWNTSIGYIGNNYMVDRTIEYQSPNFHQTGFWPFLIYIGLLVVVLGLSKKKMGSGLLFTSAAWLVMSLYSARNIPLFAIVAAPLLVQGLDDLLISTASHLKPINQLIKADARFKKIDSELKGFIWPILSVTLTLLGLSLGFAIDTQGQGYAFDPEVFPVEAVNWLEENPQEGEMFNYFQWGGYLLYRLWPEERVFIDGQTDFYGEAFLRQYAQVIGVKDGWEDVLDQYSVAWAILPPGESTVHKMQNELDWEIIYQDETAVILHRN